MLSTGGAIMKNIKLFSLIIVFCLIFLTFACSQTVVDEITPKYETFKIGTTLKIGDFKFCLNSARWSNGDDYFKPETGYIWLLIDCTVQNLNSKPEIVSSMTQFKLSDKEGYSQTQSWLAYTTIKGSLDGELSPNQIMRGEIAYEVEINQSYWEFAFKPNLFDSGQVIYSIKKEQVK